MTQTDIVFIKYIFNNICDIHVALRITILIKCYSYLREIEWSRLLILDDSEIYLLLGIIF